MPFVKLIFVLARSIPRLIPRAIPRLIPPPQAPQAPVDGHDSRLSGFADDDDTGQPIARHRRVPTIIVAVAVAVSIAATPTCQDHRLRRVKAAPSKRFASPLSRNGSRESYPARRCARRQGGHRPFAVAGPAYQRPAQDAPPWPACRPCHRLRRRCHWPCPCDWPCCDDSKISAMLSLEQPLLLSNRRIFPIMLHGLKAMTRKDQVASPRRIVKTTTRTDHQ